MKKVYVVTGSTGEYSDWGQWMVGAYMSDDAAEARVIELETLMKTLGAVAWCSFEQRKAAADAMRKHERGDPEFDIDYTGTRYSYVAVELKDA